MSLKVWGSFLPKELNHKPDRDQDQVNAQGEEMGLGLRVLGVNQQVREVHLTFAFSV